MAKHSTQIRVGIAGWVYPQWRKTFYPGDLTQKRELEYASRMLNSIEINGTFYSLQRPASFQKWYEQTPDGFVFSLKGPRFITHIRRLKDVEQPLANFFASGVLALREKFGAILWQFPPSFKMDLDRLEAFFKLLPHDSKVAASLAKQHDSKMEGRAFTETDANRPVRHAIEIRHASFESAEFIALLRRYHVALVVADTAGKWPYGEDVTADFVYVRLHGEEELYASGYTPEALDRWEKRIVAWAKGAESADAVRWSDRPPAKRANRDVFVYFDNDVKVRAPFDAMALADRLGPADKGSGRSGAAPVMPAIPRGRATKVRSHWPDAGLSQRTTSD